MSMTREVVRHELVRRTGRVTRVQPVAGSLVRITLTGEDLEGFRADGPADHIRVGFPGGETRDYTPSASRPGELDVDFVVHGDEGPATRWARTAAPGDELTIGGPRGSRLVPSGMTRLVIVADASALPAAARWVRMAPAGVPIVALLRVDPSETEYLPPNNHLRVQVVADDAALDTAFRALEPDDDGTFYFLAGEAGALVPLRRYLRRELRLPPDRMQVSGYWRRGVAGLDHHAPVDPDDPD